MIRIEKIDVAAQIIDGSTYIPLRFVGEALGDDVQWDGATRSITITRLETSDVDPHERDEQAPVESLSVWLEAGPPPFKRGVTVKSGQVTDIGTVSGR